LRESNKKIIIAIEIVILIILSSLLVIANLDKFENNFSQSLPPRDDSIKENELMDPITENVIEMIPQIEESTLLGYLQKLTSYGPHPTSRRIQSIISNRPIVGKFYDLPIEKVANYIYNEFESMGLEVRYQTWKEDLTFQNLRKPKYYPGWCIGNNIEATLPGMDKTSDKIFIFSAHYDSWQRSPGATDDSSGVAAILTIAKLMSQYEFNHTIRFVMFSGEEQGLLGSHSYVEESYNNNDNIIAALNADQIGGSKSVDENGNIWVIENEPSSWITEITINVSQRYSEYIGLEIIKLDISSGHRSDNINFWQFNYDSIHYHEPIDHNKNIHSPQDTIENMDKAFLIKASRLIFATLAELAWDK